MYSLGHGRTSPRPSLVLTKTSPLLEGLLTLSSVVSRGAHGKTELCTQTLVKAMPLEETQHLSAQYSAVVNDVINKIHVIYSTSYACAVFWWCSSVDQANGFSWHICPRSPLRQGRRKTVLYVTLSPSLLSFKSGGMPMYFAQA